AGSTALTRTTRWDGARWLWDIRSQELGPEACWGIDDRSRADRSTELLEAGQLREGLELYGVELSPEADQVARGRGPWSELRHLAGTWSATMHAQLGEAAPWLLAAAARDAAVERASPRLFALGGQNIARKPGLFLVGGSGRPRLEIHWSAA